MYFLIPILSDIGQALLDGLRYLLLMLCDTVYKLIIWSFELFIYVAKAEIFTNDFVLEIYKRVGLVLGIFMLFRLTFSLIQMMVDPNQISDKEKGIGSLAKKIVVVIILLGFTPTIFSEAFKLQGAILDEQIIAKIVLGKKNIDMDNFSPYFSYYLFSNFYSYSGISDSAGVCNENFYTNELPTSINRKKNFELAYKCVNEKPASGDSAYVTNFDGWTAIAIGGFTLWVIVMYVVTLGMRVAKLAFLQLIAPIPILSYLSPKKENGFQKWVQQCISTYIDVFIRLGIIYFAMLLINLLATNSNINSALIDSTGTSDPIMLNWVKLIIIIGILLFAKKAPELIGELFPGMGGKAGLDLGFGLKSRTDIAGKRFLGVASTVPIMAGQRAVQNFNKKRLDRKTGELTNRNPILRVGSALVGLGSGAARGVWYGGKDEKILGGIKQGIEAQNKSSTKRNDWIAAGGSSSIKRIVDKARQKVGLDSSYQVLQREVLQQMDKEIKVNKAVADATGKVRGQVDSVVDRAKGKITSRENNTLLGTDGISVLQSKLGIDSKVLSEIGINNETTIGDAAYFVKEAVERKKSQLNKVEDMILKGEGDLTKNEATRKSLIESINKLDKSSVVEKCLAEFTISKHIGGEHSDPVMRSNLENALNAAKVAIENLRATGNNDDANNLEKAYNELFLTVNGELDGSKHTFTPVDIVMNDGSTDRKSTAYDVLDYISTYANNVASDKNRENANLEEAKRAFESEPEVISYKANDEYNKK